MRVGACEPNDTMIKFILIFTSNFTSFVESKLSGSIISKETENFISTFGLGRLKSRDTLTWAVDLPALIYMIAMRVLTHNLNWCNTSFRAENIMILINKYLNRDLNDLPNLYETSALLIVALRFKEVIPFYYNQYDKIMFIYFYLKSVKDTGHYDMLIELLKNPLTMDKDSLNAELLKGTFDLHMGPYICKLLAQFEPVMSLQKKTVTFNKAPNWTFRNTKRIQK